MSLGAEELDAIRAEVRRFGASELSGARFETLERIPEETLESAAELGLFGLAIPYVHGGLRMDLRATGEIIAELARHDGSFATTLGLHNGLGARPLVAHGAASLRDRWLPRLATGETIAAFAATEAGAGSDLTRVRTVARREGETLHIDGEKHYVTNGGIAGLFTVLVRAPHLGPRARAMVLVPRDTPGVSIGTEERKLGLRASSTVSVAFQDVRVPVDHLLGEGTEVAHDALGWGRGLMAYGCLGTARAALEATLAHVQERRQFGKPLAHFGAVRAHLAQMARTVFAMESILAVLRAGPDLSRLSAAAKVFCSEGAWEVCDRAVQLHGALGFLEDTGVARLLRDARVTRIFEGSNDVLLVREGAALYSGAVAVSPRLHQQGHADWDLCRDVFDALLAQAKHDHGIGGLQNQWVLTGLARAGLSLVVASACLRRTASDPELAGHSARVLIEHALEPVLRLPALRGADDAIVDGLLRRSEDSERRPLRQALA